MKRLVACLFMSAFAASTVSAATIDFREIDPADSSRGYDWTVENKFDVWVASAETEPFSAVALVIGSARADLVPSFRMDEDWVTSMTLPPTDPVSQGIYAALAGGEDIGVGGFNARIDWTTELYLGELTVQVANLWSESVDPRSIPIGVSTAWEESVMGGFASSGIGYGGDTPMPAEGAGMVPFPEPATLMLLGFGGLAVLRRRKA